MGLDEGTVYTNNPDGSWGMREKPLSSVNTTQLLRAAQGPNLLSLLHLFLGLLDKSAKKLNLMPGVRIQLLCAIPGFLNGLEEVCRVWVSSLPRLK